MATGVKVAVSAIAVAAAVVLLAGGPDKAMTTAQRWMAQLKSDSSASNKAGLTSSADEGQQLALPPPFRSASR